MIKKIIIILTAVLLILAVNVNAFADDTLNGMSISAKSAVLIDAESGKVLYSKNSDSRMLIASTTKIMTALITLENANISDVVTVPFACANVEGSKMYLTSGEKITVGELLYGLMLCSGNDAAETLAYHISGDNEKFSKLMNDRVNSLSLNNTHFSNPHGLDAEDHYSSAYDLAIISAEAMKNENFEKIVSTKTITIGNRSLKNHNKLLWNYDGTLGVKTGYTKSAGRTLVSCAERNGLKLICVTLNDPDDWNDHEKLYNAAFSAFKSVTLCRAGEIVSEVEVISGKKKKVGVTADETKTELLGADTEVTYKYTLPKFVYAPVTEGSYAGMLSAYADENLIYETELYYSDFVCIDETQRITGWEKMRRMIEKGIENGMSGLGYSPVKEE